jgi:hypothetical protein
MADETTSLSILINKASAHLVFISQMRGQLEVFHLNHDASKAIQAMRRNPFTG